MIASLGSKAVLLSGYDLFLILDCALDFLSHIPITIDYHTSLLLVMEGRSRFKN